MLSQFLLFNGGQCRADGNATEEYEAVIEMRTGS
jgi:hypothetical protein